MKSKSIKKFVLSGGIIFACINVLSLIMIFFFILLMKLPSIDSVGAGLSTTPFLAISYSPCLILGSLIPGYEFEWYHCTFFGTIFYALFGMLVGYLVWKFKK